MKSDENDPAKWRVFGRGSFKTEVAFIGLPNVGKTTLFNIFTNQDPPEGWENIHLQLPFYRLEEKRITKILDYLDYKDI